MAFSPGDHVLVEAESTDRPGRRGVVEEVVRGDPHPRYRIRWDVLLMRPWGDYEMARDFKQASVWDLRNYGFELRLAFEDDRRNVAMFRSEGVPCVYFHSGYYD